jgi:hypothetical protein
MARPRCSALVYEHGIEPHVTVFDKSARTDGIFSREDFTYDHAGDVYRCPGGKIRNRSASERRCHDALSRQQAGLRSMRIEVPMLP